MRLGVIRYTMISALLMAVKADGGNKITGIKEIWPSRNSSDTYKEVHITFTNALNEEQKKKLEVSLIEFKNEEEGRTMKIPMSTECEGDYNFQIHKDNKILISIKKPVLKDEMIYKWDFKFDNTTAGEKPVHSDNTQANENTEDANNISEDAPTYEFMKYNILWLYRNNLFASKNGIERKVPTGQAFFVGFVQFYFAFVLFSLFALKFKETFKNMTDTFRDLNPEFFEELQAQVENENTEERESEQ